MIRVEAKGAIHGFRPVRDETSQFIQCFYPDPIPAGFVIDQAVNHSGFLPGSNPCVIFYLVTISFLTEEDSFVSSLI